MDVTTQLIQINQSLQSISDTLSSNSFLDTQLPGVIIGASISLLPWLYNIFTDRPKIKILVQYMYFPNFERVDKGISVDIYNHGKRSINLTKFYLKFKDGSKLHFLSENSFIGGSGFPLELKGGMSHSVNILAGKFSKDFLKQQQYPKYACFQDALGNEYKSKTSNEFWDNVFKK